jgi:hypothetical protein
LKKLRTQKKFEGGGRKGEGWLFYFKECSAGVKKLGLEYKASVKSFIVKIFLSFFSSFKT